MEQVEPIRKFFMKSYKPRSKCSINNGIKLTFKTFKNAVQIVWNPTKTNLNFPNNTSFLLVFPFLLSSKYSLKFASGLFIRLRQINKSLN